MARRKFFEEGQRPSGLVSEAVFQSWMRCYRQHPDRLRDVAFDPVTPSRVHSTLAHNRGLLQAAQPELETLERSLAGTGVNLLLTDGDGVMLYVSAMQHEVDIPTRHMGRPGSNLAERASGTTAPGIVVATGQACAVMGGEHYFDDLQALHCAAAPIRDVQGNLAGVLDLTAMTQPFGFDALQLAIQYATSIENTLLQAQSNELLILSFQTTPTLINTPLQGLAGVASDGTVVWINASGARLAGRVSNAETMPCHVEDLFGHGVETLLHLSRHHGPHSLRLANGLLAWLEVRLQSHDEQAQRFISPPARTLSELCSDQVQTEDPAQQQTPATLRECSRKLIESTLAAHNGNIAKTAQKLGISRGTLYRRIRKYGLSSG